MIKHLNLFFVFTILACSALLISSLNGSSVPYGKYWLILPGDYCIYSSTVEEYSNKTSGICDGAISSYSNYLHRKKSYFPYYIIKVNHFQLQPVNISNSKDIIVVYAGFQLWTFLLVFIVFIYMIYIVFIWCYIKSFGYFEYFIKFMIGYVLCYLILKKKHPLKGEISDHQWSNLKKLFFDKENIELKFYRNESARNALNGIFWIMRTGSSPETLPVNYPGYVDCIYFYMQLYRKGLFKIILYKMKDDSSLLYTGARK